LEFMRLNVPWRGAAFCAMIRPWHAMDLYAAPEVNSGAATKRRATAPHAPRTRTR
jgi:hypothetical protein